MPSGHFTITLQAVINELGVEGTNGILSTFSCPINTDIEIFLKEKAINFSNQRIARTHLFLRESQRGLDLLGYYTLANKILTVSPKGLSNTAKKKLERVGILDNTTSLYNVAAPLIAQLGKNYTDGLDVVMLGDELLETACAKVMNVQEEIGGTLVFIECEDKPELLDFYMRNGFRTMESGLPSEKGLIQMIRFL